MGYDFMFFKIKEISDLNFPIDHDQLPEDALANDLPWDEFHAWLLEQGGNGQGGPGTEVPYSIWLDFPDGSTINFHGNNESIYLDNHAEWPITLDVYLKFRSMEPNAVIMDMSIGNYHDETSFRAFMKENGY